MINGSIENIATAEVGVIAISATELVLMEETPPAVPFSRWALVLTIGLISLAMFIFYRRSA
jgi:hypothetical protein